MKKIYFTLAVLMLSMAWMAYLYFSRLNREGIYQESSLYTATASSGLIFCIHNDKSIFEILKGQKLLQKLVGEEKLFRLSLLKDQLISGGTINPLIENSNIYIGLSAGPRKALSLLITAQLHNQDDKPLLIEGLKRNSIQVSDAGGRMKLVWPDGSIFYLAIKNNLLLFSEDSEVVTAASAVQPDRQDRQFAAYIRAKDKLSKNSVSSLFINWNKIPPFIQAVLRGPLNGALEPLRRQDAFSVLSYNFSAERLFFTGESRFNDSDHYFNLFSGTLPAKSTSAELLPENTANYTLFAIPDYKKWHVGFSSWLSRQHRRGSTSEPVTKTIQTYRLNPDHIFPVYFKDQLLNFQLRSGEELGAINLTNGDKVRQLLLDISEDHTEDIKRFKVSGLLFTYFGDPMKSFIRPYYTIIDNYLICANQPSALNAFLSAYRSNHLLINTAAYLNLSGQVAGNAGISIYIDRKNSIDLFRKNLYPRYYKSLTSGDALGKFDAFIGQLTGDHGSFQTTLLMTTTVPLQVDSLLQQQP